MKKWSLQNYETHLNVHFRLPLAFSEFLKNIFSLNNLTYVYQHFIEIRGLKSQRTLLLLAEITKIKVEAEVHPFRQKFDASNFGDNCNLIGYKKQNFPFLLLIIGKRLQANKKYWFQYKLLGLQTIDKIRDGIWIGQ